MRPPRVSELFWGGGGRQELGSCNGGPGADSRGGWEDCPGLVNKGGPVGLQPFQTTGRVKLFKAQSFEEVKVVPGFPLSLFFPFSFGLKSYCCKILQERRCVVGQESCIWSQEACV